MTAAAPKRPQLTSDELQQLKWLLGGLLSLVAVSSVLYMEIDAWSLMALTVLATVATFLWPTLPAKVPPLVHTLTFPAIVAFFVGDLWLRTEVLPAMVRLDILLLLYRNFSYRQRRDDLQIIVLGLFLIIIAGVLTVSLAFAAQLLIYTACALALLLVVTLTDAAVGPAFRTPIPPGETPAWARHVSWPHLLRRLREVTDWRVVGLGLVLFAGVVGVSAVLFLAIPRFQFESGMFLDRLITKKARSGFSDRIQFGDVTEIAQDNSVALSVDISDPSQIPADPYWRMIVLDRYENRTFRMSQEVHATAFEQDRSGFDVVGHGRLRQGTTLWTFFLESGVSQYLPLLGRFERLRFREAQFFRYSPSLALVRLRQEPVSMLAYQVEDFDLSPLLVDRPFGRMLAEARARGRLPTPAVKEGQDQERLVRMLEEIQAGARLDAAAFGRRASEWLRRNHEYTLSPRIPAGEGDPLVRWMGSSQAGHCELFAGSFVLLARAAGFPARVVTGFHGGTWNGFSNNFTIRNSDAHAWAEIFDESAMAWLRVDPLSTTPQAAEQAQGAAANPMAARTDRSWNARLESLRVFWYRRIVSFDQRSQAETMKAVKEATQESGRRLREVLGNFGASLRSWMTTGWDPQRVIKLVATLALVFGCMWWWRTQGRRFWEKWLPRSRSRHEDPVRREAGLWLARLGQCGVRTEACRAVQPDLQRLRFGPRVTWADPRKVFRRARHALRDARRQGRAIPT